jgi:NADH:ubiquinone oxidoreductase subunit F (NADH-binding)
MAKKLLLDKAHVEGIRGYDVYRREGGYQSVEKAFKTMSPDQVTDEVKKSGLRGSLKVFPAISFAMPTSRSPGPLRIVT